VDEVVGYGWKRNLQPPERVLEELEKVLGVQKKLCRGSSRCWHLGGACGSRGGAQAGAQQHGERGARQHQVGRAVARQ
jgi:hypothetical protein